MNGFNSMKTENRGGGSSSWGNGYAAGFGSQNSGWGNSGSANGSGNNGFSNGFGGVPAPAGYAGGSSPGSNGDSSNSSSLLQEQRKVNDELREEMKKMQEQIRMMSQTMMSGGMANGAENGWANGPTGPAGPNSGWNRGAGFNNMGQGYGDGLGGGKMGNGGVFPPSRPVPYNMNMRVPKQPGDWDCPVCGNMNFNKRTHCNGRGGQCQEPKRPEYVRLGISSDQGKEGDWRCAKCTNINFSYRNQCNKCGLQKNECFAGAVVGPNSGPPMKNGDWFCPRCKNMNFAYRNKCNRPDCGFEKKDLVSSMDGKVGGDGAETAVLRKHKGYPPKDGDWECPRCYNLNFGTRTHCNGKGGGETCNLRKPEYEQYKVKAWKDATYVKSTDWDCWICSNVNFQGRPQCNKCKTDKEDCQSEELRVKDADEKE